MHRVQVAAVGVIAGAAVIAERLRADGEAAGGEEGLDEAGGVVFGVGD